MHNFKTSLSKWLKQEIFENADSSHHFKNGCNIKSLFKMADLWYDSEWQTCQQIFQNGHMTCEVSFQIGQLVKFHFKVADLSSFISKWLTCVIFKMADRQHHL
ncbi:hypothetical protein ACF0H5_018091 [Mactra antiquata]